ncbi:HPr(Ser) kinase/phosphatase [candidate division TA06 bacterium]|uniref:HPr kinase/phosphorylase n=1 Tax=candidate division TA06 bacterium TaxID=2250710 RepID=A0A933IBC9_UNCT6|nr:HPr(Ser) kinase/phosphatase [candidate division TA06 bacterium]
MKEISVQELLDDRQEFLHLELLTGKTGLERKIIIADANRPGLALSGYMGYFLWERIQIIGITETGYLETLSPDKRVESLKRITAFELPCIIISKGLAAHPELVAICLERRIPLLRTGLDTTDFIHKLSSYIDNRLAPTTTVHGTLVDVYGLGLLYTGDSGIGKSECALDLVERGHRLVADDVVEIKKRGQSVLIGFGNKLLRHHMEIRGIGIIDLATIFGIRAVRMRKRIEVEVRLKRWSDDEDYERVGLDEKPTTILGVEIPLVTVPVVPGKNISVISEVIAMNQLLKVCGYRTPEEFNNRLLESMQKKFEAAKFEEDDLE